MLHSVAHYEITCTKHHIVSDYLIKHILRDSDMRRLILNDHQRIALFVEHDSIASSLRAIEFDAGFIGRHRFGIMADVAQPGHKMLSDIFLGGQYYIFLTQRIPNAERSIGIDTRAHFDRRQIQLGKIFRIHYLMCFSA